MEKRASTQGLRLPVVFTDLDGTLLDHGDYSFTAAKPALELIRELGIPLVVCTSKTRAEVETILIDLGISGPFIVENGGGIFFPGDYPGLPADGFVKAGKYLCLPFGVPYSRIRNFIEEAAHGFSIRGFGDMDVEEVSRLTGLPHDKASLAKLREFTEPFILGDEDELEALARDAERRGLAITRGGRFFHCMGRGNDKGKAVNAMTAILSDILKAEITTIAFGDGPNDFSMLRQATIPVLIPHEDGTCEELDMEGLIHAGQPGSRGWNDAALQVIGALMNGGEPFVP
jgi:mannosyl-3-phosphoglycerate phosphatase